MQAHCQKHIKFHYFSHSNHTLLRFYIPITDKTTIKAQEKRKHQNFNNKYALKKTIISFMVFFFETKNLLFILNITPLQVRFRRVHKPRRTLLK